MPKSTISRNFLSRTFLYKQRKPEQFDPGHGGGVRAKIVTAGEPAGDSSNNKPGPFYLSREGHAEHQGAIRTTQISLRVEENRLKPEQI